MQCHKLTAGITEYQLYLPPMGGGGGAVRRDGGGGGGGLEDFTVVPFDAGRAGGSGGGPPR